jgi:lysophospholipase L1-like esterase
MPDFVNDNAPLPDPKNEQTVPLGKEARFIRGQDYNALRDAALSLRTHVQEIRTVEPTPVAITKAAEAAASAVSAASARDGAVAAETAAAASATNAVSAKTAAETARDAANATGTVYPDTTTGLAATTEGAYFNVPSSATGEATILYRKVGGAAVEQKRLPSATGVAILDASGQIINGFQPYVAWRHARGDAESDGNADYLVAKMVAPHEQASATVAFNAVNWRVWTPDVAAGLNWKVWIRDTAAAFDMAATAPDDSGTLAAADVPHGNALLPLTLRLNTTLRVTAGKVVFVGFSSSNGSNLAFRRWLYDAGVSPARHDYHYSLAAGWPAAPATGYQDAGYGQPALALFLESEESRTKGIDAQLASAVTSNAVGELRGAFVPYVGWKHVLGDAEMDGDADYATAKAIGFYEQMTEPTAFNAVQGRIWETDIATAVEWRVWIRDDAAPFNMGTVTPDDSGSIAAADFPHANVLYTLKLNQSLRASTGQYVFVMFRAASGVAVQTRRWLYDAGASPARHGFPWSSTGWALISIGDPALGFGNVTMKLLLESEELRAKGVAPAEGVTYDNAASGLTGATAQAAIDELAGRTSPAPTLIVPPTLYATQGREVSIYFDNILPEGASDYLWDVSNGPAEAKHQNERWTLTPAGAVASTPLTIEAIDRRRGTAVASAVVNVVGAAAAAGTGATLKAIFIGDSLTYAAVYTQELLTIAAAGGALGLTLHGTVGVAPNKHEGRGGWSVDTYTKNYSDAYGANPFWIGGQVNFPAYLAANSIPVPDWVFIMLGTNDAMHATSDAGALAVTATEFPKLDVLIASIKAAGAGVKVGLMTSPPPSSDQDAFGANYGVGRNRWRVKRDLALWVRELIAEYGGRTAERIYVVPTHMNLDTANNMSRAVAGPVNSRSTVQVARQSNGVHPATEGYYQIADTVWAFLKNNV